MSFQWKKIEELEESVDKVFSSRSVNAESIDIIQNLGSAKKKNKKKLVPLKRWGHTCTEAYSRLFIIGGFNESYLGDIWVYDFKRLTFEQAIIQVHLNEASIPPSSSLLNPEFETFAHQFQPDNPPAAAASGAAPPTGRTGEVQHLPNLRELAEWHLLAQQTFINTIQGSLRRTEAPGLAPLLQDGVPRSTAVLDRANLSEIEEEPADGSSDESSEEGGQREAAGSSESRSTILMSISSQPPRSEEEHPEDPEEDETDSGLEQEPAERPEQQRQPNAEAGIHDEDRSQGSGGLADEVLQAPQQALSQVITEEVSNFLLSWQIEIEAKKKEILSKLERSNHTAVFYRPHNSIYIFGGGLNKKKRFNDLLRVHLPRMSSCSTYSRNDKDRSPMTPPCLGGLRDCSDDLDYEPSEKKWIFVLEQVHPKVLPGEANPRVPNPRTYHATTIIKNFMVVIGGESGRDLDDLQLFNFEKTVWYPQEVEGKTNFAPKRFHTANTIPGNKVATFGGCFGEYFTTNVLNVFEFQFSKGNPPEDWSPAAAHALSQDEGQQYLSKVVCTKVVTEQNIPRARWGHAAAVYENALYVFGGRNEEDLNDIQKFDFDKLKWSQVHSSRNPLARRRHTCSIVGNTVLMFGGFNGDFMNDLNLLKLKKKEEISEEEEEEERICAPYPTNFPSQYHEQLKHHSTSAFRLEFCDENEVESVCYMGVNMIAMLSRAIVVELQIKNLPQHLDDIRKACEDLNNKIDPFIFVHSQGGTFGKVFNGSHSASTLDELIFKGPKFLKDCFAAFTKDQGVVIKFNREVLDKANQFLINTNEAYASNREEEQQELFGIRIPPFDTEADKFSFSFSVKTDEYDRHMIANEVEEAEMEYEDLCSNQKPTTPLKGDETCENFYILKMRNPEVGKVIFKGVIDILSYGAPQDKVTVEQLRLMKALLYQLDLKVHGEILMSFINYIEGTHRHELKCICQDRNLEFKQMSSSRKYYLTSMLFLDNYKSYRGLLDPETQQFVDQQAFVDEECPFNLGMQVSIGMMKPMAFDCALKVANHYIPANQQQLEANSYFFRTIFATKENRHNTLSSYFGWPKEEEDSQPAGQSQQPTYDAPAKQGHRAEMTKALQQYSKVPSFIMERKMSDEEGNETKVNEEEDPEGERSLLYDYQNPAMDKFKTYDLRSHHTVRPWSSYKRQFQIYPAVRSPSKYDEFSPGLFSSETSSEPSQESSPVSASSSSNYGGSPHKKKAEDFFVEDGKDLKVRQRTVSFLNPSKTLKGLEERALYIEGVPYRYFLCIQQYLYSGIFVVDMYANTLQSMKDLLISESSHSRRSQDYQNYFSLQRCIKKQAITKEVEVSLIVEEMSLAIFPLAKEKTAAGHYYFLVNMIVFADYFQIPGLAEQISKTLTSLFLNLETVIILLIISKSFRITPMFKECIKFIAQNTHQREMVENWNLLEKVAEQALLKQLKAEIAACKEENIVWFSKSRLVKPEPSSILDQMEIKVCLEEDLQILYQRAHHLLQADEVMEYVPTQTIPTQSQTTSSLRSAKSSIARTDSFIKLDSPVKGEDGKLSHGGASPLQFAHANSATKSASKSTTKVQSPIRKLSDEVIIELENSDGESPAFFSITERSNQKPKSADQLGSKRPRPQSSTDLNNQKRQKKE